MNPSGLSLDLWEHGKTKPKCKPTLPDSCKNNVIVSFYVLFCFVFLQNRNCYCFVNTSVLKQMASTERGGNLFWKIDMLYRSRKSETCDLTMALKLHGIWRLSIENQYLGQVHWAWERKQRIHQTLGFFVSQGTEERR